MIPFMFSLIFDFSLRRGGGLFSILFTPIKFLIYLFDALRPRRAPTFWPAESRQRLAKEGCAPFGIPPLAVALECLRHNRARGVTELLAAYAAGASGRFAKALPQKPFRTRSHARSRMTGKLSPLGNVGGKGALAPNRRVTGKRPLTGNVGGKGAKPPTRSGGGAAAVASAHALAAFPNGTEAPAAKRRGVRPKMARQRRLGGFQRGASSTPLWSGDPQGGETPLRLSFAYFSAGAEK